MFISKQSVGSVRPSVVPKVPALLRTNSKDSSSTLQEEPVPRPASQASVTGALSHYPVNRAASVTAIRPTPSSTDKSSAKPSAVISKSSENTNIVADKPKPKPRPSSIAAPNIPPRTNRSAALRLAKQEAEAAAAAAARKPVRKVPGELQTQRSLGQQ